MKAIIEKKSGFCVFYLSDSANIAFNPTLEVKGNTTNNGNFSATFLTETDVEIYDSLPEVDWKPMAFKIENGAWVDYSEEINAEKLQNVRAHALAARDEILKNCVDKTSQEWVDYKNALANIESLPGFPFTHEFPQEPKSEQS